MDFNTKKEVSPWGSYRYPGWRQSSWNPFWQVTRTAEDPSMVGPDKRDSSRKNWLWRRPRNQTAGNHAERLGSLRSQPFLFFPEEFPDGNQEAYENLLEHVEEQDFKPAATVKTRRVTPVDHLYFLNHRVVSIKDLDEAPQQSLYYWEMETNSVRKSVVSARI